MTKILLCDCGARLESPPEGKVYCASCGALLAYGEGPAVAVEPQRPRAAKERRRHKPRRRAEPGAETGEDSAAAAPSTFVPEAPSPGGRRRKRRRLPPQPDSHRPPHWLWAWIDPVTFFWLPVLVPPLAGGSGVIIVAAQLISFRGIGVPFVFLGAFVLLAPLAFLLGHATSVLAAWGTGSKADPGWPTLDVGEIYHNLVRWLCCLAATAVLFLPLRFAALWTGAFVEPTAQIALDLALGYLAGLYFSLVLLGVSLWEDLYAAMPWFVLQTVWRLGRRLVPFAVELLLGVIGIGGSLLAVAASIGHDIALGIIAWACWWTLLIFWLLRTMRALGSLCHRNQKRLGWFRE